MFVILGVIVLALVALFFVLVVMPPLLVHPEPGLIPKDRVDGQNGVRNAGIAALVALGAGATTYYGARTYDLNRQGQRADRYAKAAEQLGDEKAAAVRLAGAYAMAQLADDWFAQRQTCIDVLCAYVRMPYDPRGSKAGEGEREVRQSIIRVISDHLVPRLEPQAAPRWYGYRLDFTGAVFDGASFEGAEFSGGKVLFEDAKFSDGEVSFNGAAFSGAQVYFNSAEFSGGKISFNDAKFSKGRVLFNDAKFSGALVSFDPEKIVGSRAPFQQSPTTVVIPILTGLGAKFSGGEVSFEDAEFSGGKVSFKGAELSGAKVSFSGARFFGGEVDLAHVTSWEKPPVGLPTPPPENLLLPPPSK